MQERTERRLLECVMIGGHVDAQQAREECLTPLLQCRHSPRPAAW